MGGTSVCHDYSEARTCPPISRAQVRISHRNMHMHTRMIDIYDFMNITSHRRTIPARALFQNQRESKASSSKSVAIPLRRSASNSAERSLSTSSMSSSLQQGQRSSSDPFPDRRSASNPRNSSSRRRQSRSSPGSNSDELEVWGASHYKGEMKVDDQSRLDGSHSGESEDWSLVSSPHRTKKRKKDRPEYDAEIEGDETGSYSGNSFEDDDDTGPYNNIDTWEPSNGDPVNVVTRGNQPVCIGFHIILSA